jgi:2,4-dienoyl-CoA reductase-like NADH-dependent reductase (Old Yellow Enzyme family)
LFTQIQGTPFSGKKIDRVELHEGGWQVYGPTDVAFNDKYPKPLALDIPQIDRVHDAFVAAAHRAKRCGFDLIEIHAAHGYLMSTFISPLTNTRTDEYGGSVENRAKLVTRVIRTIRSQLPDLAISVRLSSTDWAENGLSENDFVQTAKLCVDAGADVIHCSSGGVVDHQKIAVKPGYQIPFAQLLRNLGVPVIGVGLITSAKQANEIVESGVDLIAIAREGLRDPQFALRAARELNCDVEWTLQSERGYIKPKL